MIFIEWNDALSVQIPEFDAEHKGLVETINKLHEAMGEGRGSDVMQDILRKLSDYAGTHFKNEEEFMISNNFSETEFEAHRKEHVYFIMKLDEFHKEYGDRGVAFPNHVLNFLESWFLGHVQKTDLKYSDLRKRG